MSLEILEMLWTMMPLIFKTSSVTPHFFYVFNLILSFSTCSESFEKICAWGLIISHNTIQIGSNWYMDTGVRGLEVAFFKANST